MAHRRQKGLSLVELMIAMTIGLVLTLGVATIFEHSARTRTQTQAASESAENARLALDILATDIAQVGFYGDFGADALDSSALSYSGTASSSTPPTVDDDCSMSNANMGAFPAISGTASALKYRFLWARRANVTSPALGCAPSSPLSGTDLILVRRLLADEITRTEENDERFYAFSNMSQMIVYPGGTTANPADSELNNGRRFQYQTHLYYLSNSAVDGTDQPSLFVRYLVADGDAGKMSEVTNGPLVSGIEDIQFEFGIDDTGDRIPERYVATPDMTESIWNDGDSSVVAVKIFVLARALDKDSSYTDTPTFTLGAKTYTPDADGYRRTLLTTTVFVRNAI